MFFSFLLLSIAGFSQYSSADFENIGIEHNRILDQIYLRLQAQQTKEHVGKIVEQVVLQELDNLVNYSNDDIQLAKRNIVSFVANPNVPVDQLYDNNMARSLSSDSKRFLDSLNRIIDLYNSSSVADFNLQVGNLEKEISTSNLPLVDIVILYSATNTAKYSNVYWSQNTAKWVALNDKESTSSSRLSCCGGVVKADVAGAVGGAIGAAAVNLLPGAGQVAYGSAILGGAVGNSAVKAVENLLNWLWH